jgi:hypothetical protein
MVRADSLTCRRQPCLPTKLLPTKLLSGEAVKWDQQFRCRDVTICLAGSLHA